MKERGGQSPNDLMISVCDCEIHSQRTDRRNIQIKFIWIARTHPQRDYFHGTKTWQPRHQNGEAEKRKYFRNYHMQNTCC